MGVSDVVADDDLTPRRARRARLLRRLHRRRAVVRRVPGRPRGRGPSRHLDHARPTASATACYSAIVRATKPADWTPAAVRAPSVTLPLARPRRPGRGVRLLRRNRLLLGALAASAAARSVVVGATGNGRAIGSAASRLRPSASNRSRPRSVDVDQVGPAARCARSAATRATPGPHIIPWPPGRGDRDALDPVAVGRERRAEDRQVVGRVVDRRRPDPAEAELARRPARTRRAALAHRS